VAYDAGITFDRPPVTEVSLGRSFLPRSDFLLPYYGLFAAEIAEAFPKTEHAPIVVTPGEETAPDEWTFLPRVLYLAEDGSRLVGLQANRYHLNWRRDVRSNVEYIRFPAVQDLAMQYWDRLDSFVKRVTGTALHPVNAELTYTNIVEDSGYGNMADLVSATLRDWQWTPGARFLAEPAGFSQNLTFALEGVGKCQFTVTGLVKKADNSPALRIELTTRGACSSESSLKEWSNQAHDFLVKAFKDLISDEMHQKWQLQEAQR
jgi:uncharacterized protein (TIGR04255 family)